MLIELMYRLAILDHPRERLFLFSGKTTGSYRDSLGVWVLLGLEACQKHHHSVSWPLECNDTQGFFCVFFFLITFPH